MRLSQCGSILIETLLKSERQEPEKWSFEPRAWDCSQDTVGQIMLGAAFRSKLRWSKYIIVLGRGNVSQEIKQCQRKGFREEPKQANRKGAEGIRRERGKQWG